jgi:hypothetical protein
LRESWWLHINRDLLGHRNLFDLALRLVLCRRLNFSRLMLFGSLLDDIFFGYCAVLYLLYLVSWTLCAANLQGSALLRSHTCGQEVHVTLNRRLGGGSASLCADTFRPLPCDCELRYRLLGLNFLGSLLYHFDLLHYCLWLRNDRDGLWWLGRKFRFLDCRGLFWLNFDLWLMIKLFRLLMYLSLGLLDVVLTCRLAARLWLPLFLRNAFHVARLLNFLCSLRAVLFCNLLLLKLHNGLNSFFALEKGFCSLGSFDILGWRLGLRRGLWSIARGSFLSELDMFLFAVYLGNQVLGRVVRSLALFLPLYRLHSWSDIFQSYYLWRLIIFHFVIVRRVDAVWCPDVGVVGGQHGLVGHLAAVRVLGHRLH